jgi:hypothetical protein
MQCDDVNNQSKTTTAAPAAANRQTGEGTALRRLFPTMTVFELSKSLNNAGAEQAEKIRLAIRQRDPLSADFIKPFEVPQITGNFTLKA